MKLSTWLSRIFIEAVVALGLAASCSVAQSSSLPEELLGQWYYTGSSGGLTGGGHGDAPSGYVVIRAEGTIDRHEEGGALVETTRFTAGRGRTIFSEDDLWILDLEGDGPEAVIRLSPDARMLTLSDNAYDGFSRSYARSR